MASAYALLGLGLLGLIVSTPFVLTALAPANTDWGKLSDISQTYGAVSVVLSAIALAGVWLYRAVATSLVDGFGRRPVPRMSDVDEFGRH
ncbi:hypothetical protein ACOZCG_31870, partial [Streptomyces pseudogriseolus]|uniref:hypothetical protein n=1 Tax=Streptomyces pseudogriseolus TaxID=36817 RepID=UPI003FA2231D